MVTLVRHYDIDLLVFSQKKCNIKQYENQLKLVEYTGRGQAILMYSTEVGKVKENDLKMQLNTNITSDS